MSGILGSMHQPGYMTPFLGLDGVWWTAGALAIRESLSLGSFDGVMDILDAMTTIELTSVLREVGFYIPPEAIDNDRAVVLNAVMPDILDAINLKADGYELYKLRGAAKADLGTGMGHDSFDAIDSIRTMLRSNSIEVHLLGDIPAGDRASLLFVAGQALHKGLQGFGFDGIEGKYLVPLSMAEVADLHRDAACAVAEESARAALATWANGAKINDLSELVPDSVQRLLYGSLSVSTVSAVVNAIENGLVGRHAGDIGAHTFNRLLKEQGYDVHAATVDMQARELGLVLVEPDTSRGQYVGSVVGSDHRAVLIKFARDKSIELPFKEIPNDQPRPNLGDTVRMKFKAGDLTVSMAERTGREGIGR